MAIGINDLDDDDVMIELTTEEPSNQQPTYLLNDNSDDDFMSEFLRLKGIEDPQKIKFEDDNGEIIERSWNDLSKQEQLNILNTPLPTENGQQLEQENDYDLSDEEIDLLNNIRQSNLSPREYLNQVINEHSANLEPIYKVDDLSDEDLYILDLESKVGELSDDEAAQALNQAQQNEELFKKQVEGIRKLYKQKEDDLFQLEQALMEQEQREAFAQYQNAVIDSINSFNAVGNLDLNFDDSDKRQLAEFMLNIDEDGKTPFSKAFEDPQTLVRAAWFILNGEEAFNDISDYFTNLIKLVSKNQYNKGLEEGKKGIVSKPELVIAKKPNRQTPISYKTIDDLDD